MPSTYRRVASSAVPLLFAVAVAPGLKHGGDPSLDATLSEWKIQLSSVSVRAGRVTLRVQNAGSIPHALEVEGQGLEEKTGLIQPGSSATLTLKLRTGSYEVYCPVGEDSHKKLGMMAHLNVVSDRTSSGYGPVSRKQEPAAEPSGVPGIEVSGAAPAIQILPGPFPFRDSVAAVLPAFGEERTVLESQITNGPYSNNVARISGKFSFSAWDKGAVRDSVVGVGEFTTQDQAHWRLALDRVQTKDVPHHPRFGGVIMGLYYHGMTTVHTPLVPTINSAVALWAVGHLYRNDALVTDNAQVHVMLLSRTRRSGDFALACWDCSKNKIEEVQLQVTPAAGEPKFEVPGGFLFVNWERSSEHKLTG